MTLNKFLETAEAVLSGVTHTLPHKRILKYVRQTHAMANTLKKAASDIGSPLYIIDKKAIISEAENFRHAFGTRFSEFQPYFAMKSNNHPYVTKTLTSIGYGIDVSSGAELKTAIEAGAEKIVFNGPAKTLKELKFAAEHADKLIIILDSENELKKLSAVTKELNVRVKAGVRVTTQHNALWRKFGIEPESIFGFMKKAAESPYIDLIGLHFHSSWNLTPDNHVHILEIIGNAIAEMPEEFRRTLQFIDIGGGYWVEEGEWMLADTAPEVKLKKQLLDHKPDPLDHRYISASHIEDYAEAIHQAFIKFIDPFVKVKIFAEPGRFIAHRSMHLLLTVEDIKKPDITITDGATNMIGWERYEMDYFPVVNISKPSETEKPMLILGSLCTPHDVWGFAYFGESMNISDLLVIPNQGAYTYCLRQDFIKEIPACALLDTDKGTIESI